MNFSLYIAKRYLYSKSSTNAINIITFIAMFGVVVGTAALFIVLSGFSGLRTFSDSLLEVSDPDLKILPATGKRIQFSPELHGMLNSSKSVVTYAKVLEERASLMYRDKNHIAYIKGVDTSFNQVVAIDSAVVLGTWLDYEYVNTAVVGSGISYALSLNVGDLGEPLKMYVPKPGKKFIMNPNKAFNSVKTQVIGIYTGSEEFQGKFVFTSLALAQELLGYDKNEISAIEVKLVPGVKPKQVKAELQRQLGAGYEVKTKKELNALYYKVVNTENFISYLIFTLIIIIALFSVIGSIIMMIIDKRKNLKTLLFMGASLADIKKIFVYQGFLLVLVGMCIGLCIGGALVALQLQFGWFKITASMPYPVELRWSNFTVVVLTIICLGFIASKIASARISASFINK